jgi:hypothetical protein
MTPIDDFLISLNSTSNCIVLLISIHIFLWIFERIRIFLCFEYNYVFGSIFLIFLFIFYKWNSNFDKI